MYGPGDYQTKWSKSDRERLISYDIDYMWYLKWTYLQNRNKPTDLESKLPVTKGWGSGINWEFGIDLYKLLYL